VTFKVFGPSLRKARQRELWF